jgi:hypothetical protein
MSLRARLPPPTCAISRHVFEHMLLIIPIRDRATRVAAGRTNGIDHPRRVMPIGFHMYRDFRLLFIRGQGVITQPERVATILAWLRDPGYQDCTDALFDVTAAESTPGSQSCGRSLRSFGNTCLAAVLGNSPSSRLGRLPTPWHECFRDSYSPKTSPSRRKSSLIASRPGHGSGRASRHRNRGRASADHFGR